MMTDAPPLPADEDAPELRPFDAGDPVALAARKRKTRLRQQDTAAFWKSVFALESGRLEMWSILQLCGYDRQTKFACGPNGFPQTEATWFHAGEYTVGEQLFKSWLSVDPAGVMKMLAEHDPTFTKPGAE